MGGESNNLAERIIASERAVRVVVLWLIGCGIIARHPPIQLQRPDTGDVFVETSDGERVIEVKHREKILFSTAWPYDSIIVDRWENIPGQNPIFHCMVSADYRYGALIDHRHRSTWWPEQKFNTVAGALQWYAMAPANEARFVKF